MSRGPPMAETARTCPTCGEAGNGQGWCDHCHRRIGSGAVVRVEHRSSSRRPRRWMVQRSYLHWTAALMSLLIPGAGQVYKGRTLQGVAWFVAVLAGYLTVGAPALLIHLMCVVSAGSAARVRGHAVVDQPSRWSKR